MDRRKLRRLDYVAGVQPSDDLITRDIKRARMPSLYTCISDHALSVDVGIFDTLDGTRQNSLLSDIVKNPFVDRESGEIKDCMLKTKLCSTRNTTNPEISNGLLGHTCNAAELAIRQTMEIEQ